MQVPPKTAIAATCFPKSASQQAQLVAKPEIMKLNTIGKKNNTMISNFTAMKSSSDAFSRQKPSRVMLLTQLKSGNTSGIQLYETS